MTVLEYIETVLDGVEKYRPDQTVFIVSLDRRMLKSWSPSGKGGGESSVLIYAVTPP